MCAHGAAIRGADAHMTPPRSVELSGLAPDVEALKRLVFRPRELSQARLAVAKLILGP